MFRETPSQHSRGGLWESPLFCMGKRRGSGLGQHYLFLKRTEVENQYRVL